MVKPKRWDGTLRFIVDGLNGWGGRSGARAGPHQYGRIHLKEIMSYHQYHQVRDDSYNHTGAQ